MRIRQILFSNRNSSVSSWVSSPRNYKLSRRWSRLSWNSKCLRLVIPQSLRSGRKSVWTCLKCARLWKLRMMSWETDVKTLFIRGLIWRKLLSKGSRLIYLWTCASLHTHSSFPSCRLERTLNPHRPRQRAKSVHSILITRLFNNEHSMVAQRVAVASQHLSQSVSTLQAPQSQSVLIRDKLFRQWLALDKVMRIWVLTRKMLSRTIIVQQSSPQFSSVTALLMD